MLSTDVRPTRLDAAKAAAQTFLERAPEKLRGRPGDVLRRRQRRRGADTRPRACAPLGREITRWQAGGGLRIGDALARAVELGQSRVRRDGRSDGHGLESPRERGQRFSSSPTGGRTGVCSRLRRARRARLPRGSRYSRSPSELTVRMGLAAARPGASAAASGFNRVPDRATLRAIAEATGRRVLRGPLGDRGRVGLSPARLANWHEDRPTQVTALFVGAAAVVLTAGAALARLAAPGLP